MHFSRGISGGIVLLVGFLQKEFFITKKTTTSTEYAYGIWGNSTDRLSKCLFQNGRAGLSLSNFFMMKKRLFFIEIK